MQCYNLSIAKRKLFFWVKHCTILVRFWNTLDTLVNSQKKRQSVILRSSISTPASGPVSACIITWCFPSGNVVNNQFQPCLSCHLPFWNKLKALIMVFDLINWIGAIRNVPLNLLSQNGKRFKNINTIALKYWLNPAQLFPYHQPNWVGLMHRTRKAWDRCFQCEFYGEHEIQKPVSLKAEIVWHWNFPWHYTQDALKEQPVSIPKYLNKCWSSYNPIF